MTSLGDFAMHLSAKVFLTLVIVSATSALPANSVAKNLTTIRILHNNDMHARFKETTQDSIPECLAGDSGVDRCYGGFARVATLVKKAKSEASGGVPTFFLNAGDTYQGSALFTAFKGQIATELLNALAPDVASLGNHEFDQGVAGALPLLQGANFPIVAANLDWSREPEVLASGLKKSHVLQAGDRKIGVIGYLTPETKTLSMTDNIIFFDEIESIRKEIEVLKAQGVSIFIALGHSGYARDLEIAKEVEDVDLVIGGHSNTFLCKDNHKPDYESCEGEYPTVVTQPKSGRKVYVVQAYAYTKYLGDLTIKVDDDGEIIEITGEPVLVDPRVEQDPVILQKLEVWMRDIEDIRKQVVGETRVLLVGNDKICRVRECNLGNLISDAMVHYHVTTYGKADGWTDAPIALIQSGSIRTSIERGTNDKVTLDGLLAALPFESNLATTELDGKTLLQVFEWGISDSISENSTKHGGKFLQVSGVRVVYDLSKPINSRVVSIKTRCGICDVPVYQDLQLNKTYKILLPDYLFNGGDDFKMFKNSTMVNLGINITTVLNNYINQTSPVHPGIEGRIKFVNHSFDSSNSSNTAKLQYPVILLLLIVILMLWFKS